ncbi:hypothetical protein RQP46_010652 [Phenoliferia psychrophenolica]
MGFAKDRHYIFAIRALLGLFDCWQSMVGLSNALTGLLGFVSFMTAVTIGALLPDSPATAKCQLLNIPLGVLSIIFYLTTGYVAKRSKQTYLTMAAFTIPNIVGTVVIITVPPTLKTRAGLLIAFYIMQFFVALNPLIFSLLARNVAGQTKRTVAYGAYIFRWPPDSGITDCDFYTR